MIFDFLHNINRAGSPAWFLRGSLRRSDPFSKSQTLPVPVRAVSWEPTREPADCLRGPAEVILRASELPSAPASALREVTQAADRQVVGKGTDRRLGVADSCAGHATCTMQISQICSGVTAGVCDV